MSDRKRSIIVFSASVALAGMLFLLGFRYLAVRLQATSGEKASYSLRLPVRGQDRLHQTMQVIDSRGRKGVMFDVFPEKGEVVETGIVRTDRTDTLWGYSGEFRFRIYHPKWYGKDVLFEDTIRLALNERFTVRLDQEILGDTGREQTIVCEIEKEDESMAKGYEAHSDFQFLVPNEFAKSGKGDLNVIIVSLDTLRADHLGCYGYERDTSPNIDEFARRSILFSDALSSSPWTTPSHQSIFTGLYPSAHQNGGLFTFNGDRRIRAESEDADFFRSQQTLTSVLRDHGYNTIAITGNGFLTSRLGFGNGFNICQESSAVGRDAATGIAESERIFTLAMEWLEENSDDKFFLFVHTYECHIPYQSEFFVSEDVRSDLNDLRMALYDGDIRTADTYFGKFLEKVDALGLTSNTLVVLLSDHGEEFGDHYTESDMIPPPSEEIPPNRNALDHGHSQYEEMIHVPLIFYIPGFEAPKTRIENQVRLIDVMPTTLDILNIEYDGPMQGVSLLELLRTGQRSDDPPSISEFNEGGPERKAIRKDGYKYIWIKHPDDCKRNCFKNLARHELFDLRKDPDEMNNIFLPNEQLSKEYHKILMKQLEESRGINEMLRAGFSSSGRATGEIDKNVSDSLKALGYLQ